MIQQNGQYLTIAPVEGGISITATEEAIAQKNEFVMEVEISSGHTELLPQEENYSSWYSLWFSLLEDILCNSEWELTSSDETKDQVADTCPILLFEADRDDEGDYLNHGRKFYFANYAILSEWRELFEGRSLFFPEAK